MSFSHEMLQDKKFNYYDFFTDCQKFVNKHFGKENVFNWAFHCDEKTPHITFQFLPKDEKGNLNARKIFGNKKTLSEWQDKFHEEVGQKYGLKRGIKKTNLIHETLNRFYGAIKNLDEDLDKLRQEFPSNPTEAFITTGCSVFNTELLTKRKIELLNKKPKDELEAYKIIREKMQNPTAKYDAYTFEKACNALKAVFQHNFHYAMSSFN